jgi:bifunctional non-homologous end joining protein LigD
VYYLFDVLWSECQDFTSKPVLKRRERLAQIISPVDGIQVGSWIPDHGQRLFHLAKEKGFEGIVAKRIASIY